MPAIRGGYIEFERPEYERPEWAGRPVDPGWGVPEGGAPGHLPGYPGHIPDHGFDPNYPDHSLPGEQPGTPPHLPDDQIVLAMHIPGRGWKHKMFPMPTGRPGQGLPPQRPGIGGGPIYPEGPEVQPPHPGQGLPGRPEYPSQRPPYQPPAGGIGGRPPDTRPPPPVAGQPLPRPPVTPPAGGIGGRPPDTRPPGLHPDQNLPEPQPPGQPPLGTLPG
jgi:hypothetical protein